MRKLVRAGVAVAVLAAAGFAWAVNPPPAAAEPECLWISNDYNRDGRTDVAIGAPGATSAAGAVEVKVSEGDATHTYRVTPPDGRAGDQFGAAVAEVAATEGDLDQERCSQLVVGAPGRDVAGRADAGAIYVYAFIQNQGFALVSSYTLDSPGVPGTAQANARFGAALAAPFHADDIGPVQTPLYVGAPGYTVGTAKGAGAFLRLTFTTDDDQAVDTGSIVTQDSAGVPGAAEAGDALGSALAATPYGVVAGTPGEDLGSANNAGSVLYWHTDPAAETIGVNQNTAGIPGAVEAGDQFGSALYDIQEGREDTGNGELLVGIPRENVGRAVDAGMVTLIPVVGGSFQPGRAIGYTQNTQGVAGTAEAYDHLGATVGSYGPYRPLAGVPGEDVGTVADAGMVEALDQSRAWTENTAGQPGRAENGDRFGAVIGNALVPYVGVEDWYLGSLLVGVPGEDGARGAVAHGLVGPGSQHPEEWKAQQPHDGDRYGSALGKYD
ncbi:MAG: hypothetical protein J2P24_02395 [Streptosporangiales bacterium]|nr:hypothetical protein [Streptosporangiales bacterium]